MRKHEHMAVKLLAVTLMAAAAALAAVSSCSTTKVLSDGEYRLAKNKVTVTNDKKFPNRELTSYIQQQSNRYFIFGWNPFLNVYNWENGKGKGWDKFVHKIGVAPVVYDPDLVGSSEENIERHLQYLGYYNSDVNAEVSVKKRRVTVNYNVELGKQIPIRSLSWDVPDGILKEVFEKDTANITIKPGMPLAESTLEKETQRSSKYLRDNGFFGLSKNYYFFEADTLSTADSADLGMFIREYTRNESPSDASPLEQYHIGKVTITHPNGLKFREKVLRNINTIKPGQMYSEKSINESYSRFSALQVFNAVNIEMTPNPEEKTVDCNVTMSQSKLQGFKVNLEGSVNSTGLLGVSPQVSYFNKNIFHGGEWMNLSFMGNFQFKPKEHVRAIEFGASAGLSFPKFLGLPYRVFKGPIPRTDINISYNYQDRPEYTRNIVSASYGYTGTYKEKFSYQVYPAQLSIVHLNNLDQDFFDSLNNDPFLKNAYQDHFDLGAGGTLYYTTNPSTNPQTSYFYTRFQLDLAGNFLSIFKGLMAKDEFGAGIVWNTPYSQYVRAELTVGKTWRFGRNNGQAIATRILAGAGYGYGNSTALPFEKHFYAGGSSSLRGWQARSVGPGLSKMDDTFVIPNQTGDMKLEANIEYRFDMFWKLEGALFADAGNVWTIRRKGMDGYSPAFITAENLAKGIAASWGLGLRLDFNFLVVRVDWGMRVHDPAREMPWCGPKQWFKRDGYAIHFGVGYPF